MKVYRGYVPVVILDLTEAQRMMLTVRINRAKGSHVSVRMHELVTSLKNDHGLSITEIAQGIGATVNEVELLLKENVFDALNVREVKYSKAWKAKGK